MEDEREIAATLVETERALRLIVTGDLIDRDKREWLESTGCLPSRNRST